GVERELDALQQSRSRAGEGYRAADLHGIEAGARRDTLVRRAVIAGDDVGHVRSVPSEAWSRNNARSAIDRIRIRSQRTGRPLFADKIETTNHLGCGKEAVRCRVLRVRRARAVRGLIRGGRAGASEKLVRVVDTRVQDSHPHTAPVEARILDSLRS